MFSRRQFDAALETVANHYEFTAPTVNTWANDLASASDNTITLADVRMLASLVADLPPGNLAANEVYHLQHRLGRSVVGQCGF
jgi:hypothetical protein